MAGVRRRYYSDPRSVLRFDRQGECRGLLAHPDRSWLRSLVNGQYARCSFYRGLKPVAAVVVNGIREIVLDDSPGSVHALQAYATSNTMQLRRTLTRTRSAN